MPAILSVFHLHYPFIKITANSFLWIPAEHTDANSNMSVICPRPSQSHSNFFSTLWQKCPNWSLCFWACYPSPSFLDNSFKTINRLFISLLRTTHGLPPHLGWNPGTPPQSTGLRMAWPQPTFSTSSLHCFAARQPPCADLFPILWTRRLLLSQGLHPTCYLSAWLLLTIQISIQKFSLTSLWNKLHLITP